MKRFGKKFFTGYQAFITLLLGLLGITSACKEMACEYGVPSAKFIVKGKIVSETDKKPLKDIRVIMNYDTTKSDVNGAYEISTIDFPRDSAKYDLKFEDVNNTDGIDYQPLDTVVAFIDVKLKDGDNHWYWGEASKTLDIELKK